MTEYWVSQAKHWCEYCRIYIAGNKSSIAFHENGKKHKEIVDLSLRDMRKRGRERRIEESEVQKEIAKIERNAMKDYMHHDVAREPRAQVAPSADRAARLAELEAKMSADRMARAFNAATGGTALPSGWSVMTNPDGKVFYLNEATGAMQWEKPTVGGKDAVPATTSAHSEVPSDDGWQRGFNEQGVPYYFHVKRGLTQWESPPGWSGAPSGGQVDGAGTSGDALPGGELAGGDAPGDDTRAPADGPNEAAVDADGERPGSQHELMLRRLKEQEQAEERRYREQLVAAADASNVEPEVDAATGLGLWTNVAEEEKPAEGWGCARAATRLLELRHSCGHSSAGCSLGN